jgi:hypothetical protein
MCGPCHSHRSVVARSERTSKVSPISWSMFSLTMDLTGHFPGSANGPDPLFVEDGLTLRVLAGGVGVGVQRSRSVCDVRGGVDQSRTWSRATGHSDADHHILNGSSGPALPGFVWLSIISSPHLHSLRSAV